MLTHFTKKVSLLKIVYLFLTWLLLSSPLFAYKPAEIIVGTDSWPPFRIHSDKSLDGLDFDLWEEIERRLNIKIIFRKYPWSRILHNLKSGELDAMSGLAKRKERELYMTYTTPSYFTCSTVFYMKKGEGHLVQKYEDLYKYPIAYVANSAYFNKFDNDSALNKHAIPSEIQLIKMLGKGRVKVIIGTDCQADYQIAKLGFSNEFEKAMFKPDNNVDLYIAISKKSHFIKELNRVNETIKQIVEEGRIKEISHKYFNMP